MIGPYVRYIPDLDDDAFAVIVPFHPRAVAEFEALGGRWDDVDQYSGLTKAWVFPAARRADVEAAVGRYWPPDDGRRAVVVTFDADTKRYDRAPTLDGVPLYAFTRAGKGPITHPDVTEVAVDAITVGGSAAKPTTGGRLVVRARVRPDVQATWQGHALARIAPDYDAPPVAALTVRDDGTDPWDSEPFDVTLRRAASMLADPALRNAVTMAADILDRWVAKEGGTS